MRPLLALAVLATAAAAPAAAETRSIVVAGGCFWCVEADFDKVEGVSETISGYAGGHVENPTYKDVTRGDSGHLEVVRITYDDAVVPLDRLLALFLRSINPTDDGGQFCDRGDSYRTAIFAGSLEEMAAAQAALAEAEAALGRPVVTRVLPAATFYPAEDYHQDFYKKSPVRYYTYRNGCGRDGAVRALWGDQAAFAGSS